MKKKLILAFPLVIILAIAIWLKSSLVSKTSLTQLNSPTPTQNQEQYSAKVTLVFSETDKKEFNYYYTDKKSAFDALKEVTDREEVKLETQQFDFGILIKSVNGFENTNEKSWIYYVNGNSADVGADKYELKNGDTIEWRYIKPVF